MNKRNNAVVFQTFVAIVTTILLLASARYILVDISPKILSTAGPLYIIHDNIRFYEKQSRKTDAMTQSIEEQMEYRRAHFYNSDDPVIRMFSNSHFLIKFLLILLALASYPIIIGYLVIKLLIFIVNAIPPKERELTASRMSDIGYRRSKAKSKTMPKATVPYISHSRQKRYRK
jgi:hypothetical protein